MLPVFQFLKKAMILCKVLNGLLFSFHIMQQKFIHVVFSYRLFIFMVIYKPIVCTGYPNLPSNHCLNTKAHSLFAFTEALSLRFILDHEMTKMLELADKDI